MMLKDKTTKNKVSIVIITKNEEKNISRCLDNLIWADEVVIIDDFSKDKTKELAIEYENVQFYQNKFEDFASQRNFGLNLAKNIWVLSIDPDEEITEPLKRELSRVLKEEKVSGCYIPTKHIFYGKHLKFGGWYPDYHIRFFKKNYSIWDKSVHEGVKITGECVYFDNAIIHYGHNTIEETIEKLNIYTTMESVSKFQNGTKTSVFKLVFTGLREFINRHIVKQGWRDGVCGLIANMYMCIYKFSVEAKLMVLQKNKT